MGVSDGREPRELHLILDADLQKNGISHRPKSSALPAMTLIRIYYNGSRSSGKRLW
ncbi:hypothetical protein M404DRAFT_1003519 [Pisolithus tinctorius Marx 270]|uniref:Uncharacterized protein n=1 Tax=Pisolithus tinctorius Marx 270 TaxID=870435 RepID=A0A0C3IVC5_PISTI|nr:hypothetical protein M404DRAFT_1003519 [Pisolithus tinctorius Marx 270]